ncbi:hypothetical protein Pmar_PMAR024872 [Perkinsus marinus ATCC 50983]|uniref:CCHC-type domain-containing protein n=1 Tax=Perkinsus marinus (strain ATCC 50983 / TXsc) TaxID=423536 RepID=C5LCV6_PERM5|nr:hypothetical protein Pmar_PMAR024872 [Perkinsus marinus ATCC 50983]EER05409.1 hypothetical protein Pmar_PMAR024872 [Perkinsus marinus ATCC 50983]|eukprot:XP_002773593.1 hypothetical protein Pmar_PMAR024872 [Perkinsus marinus ATCC 50983]
MPVRQGRALPPALRYAKRLAAPGHVDRPLAHRSKMSSFNLLTTFPTTLNPPPETTLLVLYLLHKVGAPRKGRAWAGPSGTGADHCALRTLIGTMSLGPQGAAITALLDSIVVLVEAGLTASPGPLSAPVSRAPAASQVPQVSADGFTTATRRRRGRKAQNAAPPRPGPPGPSQIPQATRRPQPTTQQRQQQQQPRRQPPAPRRQPPRPAPQQQQRPPAPRRQQAPTIGNRRNPHVAAAKKAAAGGEKPVIIIRPSGPNPPAPLSKEEFSKLRVSALQALPDHVTITGIFPVGRSSLGMSVKDRGHLPAVLANLGTKLRGYEVAPKQSRAPRVILFSPAVSKDVTTVALERQLKEENEGLIGQGATGPAVQNLHWRGPNLVMAVSSDFFRSLEASGQKVKLNRLLTRWQLAADYTVCFYCSRLGHISASCTSRQQNLPECCTRCSGPHARSACSSAQERCRNCCDFNEAQARAGRPHRRETNHQATSPGCPSVEAHCRRMAARTNYGPVPVTQRSQQC